MSGTISPGIALDAESGVWRLSGDWTLRALSPQIALIRRTLAALPHDARWDLVGLRRIDSFGATLLWGGWQRRWPEKVELSESHRVVIERVAQANARQLPAAPGFTALDAIATLGYALFVFRDHVLAFLALLGQ
ncbi:MAG: ABC transporter permease, partial [Betaproteobacteria bacterium HGW-Betaproteobacteria-19]